VIARLSSHWWLFLIRGILAILLALAALAFPGAALFSIAILFGAYAFVDGVVAIWTATRISHTDSRWGWLIFEGIVGILAGVFTFFYPFATVFALAILLGVWAIVTGVLAIASAFDARRHVPNEWLWVLTGVVSVVFGVAVFFVPAVRARLYAELLRAAGGDFLHRLGGADARSERADHLRRVASKVAAPATGKPSPLRTEAGRKSDRITGKRRSTRACADRRGRRVAGRGSDAAGDVRIALPAPGAVDRRERLLRRAPQRRGAADRVCPRSRRRTPRPRDRDRTRQPLLGDAAERTIAGLPPAR
jgi:uncharacterized membrane protein HdeD (DUF308 family)